MPQYKVVEVLGKRDLKKFIKFPDQLYKDCPQYVPALHSDQVKSLTKVSTLSYCRHKMWMVLDGDKVVGRICGMINPRYNALYDKKRARFGWFDTINDLEVARLLIETAEAWAKENGMTEIHGPLYYNTLGKQGMLIEGFQNIPPFNCIYNYPYYVDFMNALGFVKECDWVQYKVPADQPPQEKIVRIANLLKERYNLHDMTLAEMDEIWDEGKAKYNESFAKSVYNFIPFTKEEIDEEASEVLRFVTDKTSSIIFDENEELVGFGITFPSISKALQKAKGHLFPFGWYYLLRALHKNDTVDLMINGAVPKWQNTGVSSIYHCTMSEKYCVSGTKWAITNPQIESNGAANVWGKYDSELFMRRRCFVKEL